MATPAWPSRRNITPSAGLVVGPASEAGSRQRTYHPSHLSQRRRRFLVLISRPSPFYNTLMTFASSLTFLCFFPTLTHSLYTLICLPPSPFSSLLVSSCTYRFLSYLYLPHYTAISLSTSMYRIIIPNNHLNHNPFSETFKKNADRYRSTAPSLPHSPPWATTSVTVLRPGLGPTSSNPETSLQSPNILSRRSVRMCSLW